MLADHLLNNICHLHVNVNCAAQELVGGSGADGAQRQQTQQDATAAPLAVGMPHAAVPVQQVEPRVVKRQHRRTTNQTTGVCRQHTSTYHARRSV